MSQETIILEVSTPTANEGAAAAGLNKFEREWKYGPETSCETQIPMI